MSEDPKRLFSAEAENAVIGGLLIDPDVLYRVELETGEFFQLRHRHAYNAICDLRLNRGDPVDVLTVADAMREAGDNTDCLGFLSDVAARVPTSQNVGYYATLVRRYALRRRIAEVGQWILGKVWGWPVEEAGELAAEVQRRISKACDARAEITTVGAAAAEALNGLTAERMEAECVHTGISVLDEIMWGIPLGYVSLIAGRPSQGKSVLGREVALFNAARDVPTGYIALEERSKQVALNLMASLARVSITAMMRGNVSNAERERLREASDHLQRLPLYVCDERPLTADQVCHRLRQMKSEHGIKLAVLDYWNRVALPGRRNRVDEAGVFVERVTSIAAELGIALIVICQLNRENEKENRAPRLSDLKDTGGWEESATVVVMVHRPAFYGTANSVENEIELYVRKQKTGKTGMRKGYWEGEYLSIRGAANQVPGREQMDLYRHEEG